MAQTKRRRQTKHRGNAAGMVESRGRTGRKGEPDPKGSAKGGRARQTRYDKPPTWRSAFQRSLLAVVFFALIVTLLFRQKPFGALAIAVVMVPIYTVIGFYTDRWLYERRQRQGSAAAPKKR